ncbi:acyltransferase [Uliginosibacterium gangwonense]|uniref:acyltransferase n=1 Tax=Uliginosibacterium gangwonense TaxID=392736 RepID=UPI000A305F92|nr:acetyltransferase [Uliginosibacterium gangwonense]
MKNAIPYNDSIRSRTVLRYYKGLLPRYLNYLKNNFIVWVARRNGAIIGECVTMPYALAKKANKNLRVGSHTSIQSSKIDLRSPVEIGSKVIIGNDVEIMTASHNVDSPYWEYKTYGIEIEDYCWLATRVFVLPSCRRIGRGAICAAGSVIVSNIKSMDIVTGNPAYVLRKRTVVHIGLCVESLLGNDYTAYTQSRTSSQG